METKELINLVYNDCTLLLPTIKRIFTNRCISGIHGFDDRFDLLHVLEVSVSESNFYV